MIVDNRRVSVQCRSKLGTRTTRTIVIGLLKSNIITTCCKTLPDPTQNQLFFLPHALFIDGRKADRQIDAADDNSSSAIFVCFYLSEPDIRQNPEETSYLAPFTLCALSRLGASELDSEAPELRAPEVTLGHPVEGVSDSLTPGLTERAH